MKRSLISLLVIALLMIPLGIAATPQLAKADVASTGCTNALDVSVYTTHPSNITSNSNVFITAVPGANVTITSVFMGCYVNGTNDSNNYWEMEFRRLDNSAELFNLMNNGGRDPTCQNQWALMGGGTSQSVTTSMIGVYVYVVKHGSPGALHLTAPQICLD